MSMNMFNFKIATPDRVVYHDDIERITIPTRAGEITVLPDHAPLVSIVKPGELRIHKNNTIIPLACDAGVMEMRHDGSLVILSDSSYHPEDIDIQAAEDAYERARAYMKEKSNIADVEFASMQAMLERSTAQLRVAKKWRK